MGCIVCGNTNYVVNTEKFPRLGNLQILTVSEYTKLHNLREEIIRDLSSGKIIGVNKLDNIGESLEEENTETDV
jgi:hypothetical protein